MWHICHPEVFTTDEEWEAIDKIPPEAGVPSNEEIQRLARNNELFLDHKPVDNLFPPLNPVSHHRSQLAAIAASHLPICRTMSKGKAPVAPSQTNPADLQTISQGLSTIATLSGSHPLTTQPTQPIQLQAIAAAAAAPTTQVPTMSASTSAPTMPSHAAATVTAAPLSAPSNGALHGQPPTTFMGDQSKSAEFLREFRHWRLINKNNEAISIPFQRVLTALTYIKGPLVSNWADGQDKALETSTTTGGIAETDEVL